MRDRGEARPGRKAARPAARPGLETKGSRRDPVDAACARALLEWFDPSRRPMPWRGTRDPYRVWVSEVMLQQTTVATAIPYYDRFLAAFPSPAALAAASLDEVLKNWEGLGYYSRARNLHAAARRLAASNGGRIPSSAAELAALPGIGRSTAGAIASIAFGRDEPILDGNVRRVLCRLLGEREDPARAAVARRLWDASRRFILPGRGRDTALALMDLGNLVCTPRAPRCPACPLAPRCAARRDGAQGAIPAKARKKPLSHHDVVVGVVEDPGGRILFVRRPGRGLLGGLWAFPGGMKEDGEGLAEALAREIEGDLGVRVSVGEKVGEIPHAYSHYRVTIHAFRCRPARLPRRSPSRRWVPPARIHSLALPKSNRRIVERFL